MPPAERSDLPESDDRVDRVAVVGLGAMGSRIAGRLLDAGQSVTVWSRSPARTATLLARGATVADTPAVAAASATALITMVSDPLALVEVTQGPAGIAAGAHPALTLIEMSTVGPNAVQRLTEALPRGTAVLDAPVLGSIGDAEAGSLVILAGGSEELVHELETLLSIVGRIVHVGGPGAGAAAKLVANAALFASVASLGEAIALARALGLSHETTFELLALTPLAAQAVRRREAIERGEYPARFALRLARKDAELVRQGAGAAALDLPLMAGAHRWLSEAEHEGLGERDYTAVLATILGTRPPTADDPTHDDAAAPDGLIVDLDGVVWLGGDPIAGAAAAIARLRDRLDGVVFLTNDPQSSRAEQAERLSAIGIPACVTDVVTSAVATARYLAMQPALAGSVALVIGSQALRQEIAHAGFRVADADDAARADLVVVGGHERFEYADLSAATTAIRHGASLYATGRDPVVPGPGGPLPATGAILAAIETAAGVTATVLGKPDPSIFTMALERLPGCSRVAVVGDSLDSDIVGAKRAGLRAILVLTGNATSQHLAGAPVRPDVVVPSLAALANLLAGRACR